MSRNGCRLAALALMRTAVSGGAEDLVLIDADSASVWRGSKLTDIVVSERDGATALEVTIVNNGNARENWPPVRRGHADGESRHLSAFTLAAYRERVTSSDPEVRSKDISVSSNSPRSKRLRIAPNTANTFAPLRSSASTMLE